MATLAIKDIAERTGIAAGTIRMWEQRYGYPEPQRTASGYRRYTERDVEALRQVVALRERGFSMAAAIERARDGHQPDHTSIFAAVAADGDGARPQVLRRSTLIALSEAIEQEAMAQAGAPVLFAAFQRERYYRDIQLRYHRLARTAGAAVVFADFEQPRSEPGAPVEIPVAASDQLGGEWAVIADAPGFAACLLAWELPQADEERAGVRRFEAIWTFDPRATRSAARVAAGIAARHDPALGERLLGLLADRPPAFDQPAPALIALMNRLVSYLEAR